HLALPALGDYCTVLAQDDNGVLRLIGCGHVIRDRESIVRRISQRFIEQQTDVPTFTADILRTHRPRIVRHVLDSAEVQQVRIARPDLLAIGDAFKPCSYVGVPLQMAGRITGVMAFGTTTDLSNREYTEADLPLIEEFARRVS